jgi:hypothetical protein
MSDVSTLRGEAQFLLALWLVVRGRRLTVGGPGLHGDPTAVAQ